MGHAVPAAPARRIARRLWFDLHSWVGLKLSLFMAFILATGTLAVLAHEIDWLLDARMRVTPVAAEPVSWGRIVAAIGERYPDHRLLYLDAPVDPWFAARGLIVAPDGTARYAHVDPWRGVVQGDSSFFNAHRFLRNTHRHLMLPVRIGVPIVCSLALLLVVSLVSSLFVYRRWWRGFLRWPRGEQRRRWWGDVHRLLGVWSLWFVALMALTGIWYLVEQLGGAAPPLDRFGKQSAARSDSLAAYWPTAGAVDAAIDAARGAYPGLRIQRLQLPVGPDDALLVEGQAEALLVRERANAVAVGIGDARVRGRRAGRELGLHQRIAEAADPLHFGTWGGLPSKLAWFVFGTALTALSLSGAWIYALRIRASLRHEERHAPILATTATATHGSLRRIWLGMGAWRWLSLALILVSLALTPLAFRTTL